VTAVAEWLAARSPASPERLAARMRRALDDTAAGGEPFDTLAIAAFRCLEQALHARTRDDAALDLLAADGLLTYAWEAAAEAGSATLRRFAAAYPPERFATVLPEGK